MSIYNNIESGKYKNNVPYSNVYSSQQRKAYQQEQSRLTDLFKSDLEKEFGVENNPKKDKLFELAWSYGHSAGLNEVWLHYNDFVGLIK